MTGLILGIIFSFLFGLIIGSFLNVVIYRYRTGRSLSGHSGCLSCGQQLSWQELIPLWSFIKQRGRCAKCQSKISLQYPAVELITGLVFAGLWWQYADQIFTLVFYWVVSSLLLVIAVYDWRHKIIPNQLVKIFAVMGLIGPVVTGFDDWLLAAVIVRFIHVVLTGALFYFVIWSLWRFSDGKWIGLGDAKLIMGIGFLLGLAQGLTALLVAVWTGAIVGLALIGISKNNWCRKHLGRFNVGLKSELPFAPFLIAGVLIVIIANYNVLPF